MPSDDEVKAATDRLSAEDRALIELFDRRGLSAEEIAEVIGVPASEVERRHEAAQRRLAEELRTPEPAAPVEEAPPAEGPVVTMKRLNGTYGRGTVQLLHSGDRAKLRLAVSHFLRPVGGGYAVWLYNSPDDAHRLYATADTTIEREIRLPRDYADYRFVEVARAIPELNSDHSGLSLLRARFSDLTAP